MRHLLIVWALGMSLLLVACGNDTPAAQTDNIDTTDSTDSNTSDESLEQTAVGYSFDVMIGDDFQLTQENATAKMVLGVPAENYSPMFDIDANTSIGLLRVEMQDDELGVGESEVRRVSVNFEADIEGESVQIGCGGNEGTPEGLFITITELTDSRLTGTLTATLTSCTDYLTGESVDLESITVTAEFTNVPYMPEE